LVSFNDRSNNERLKITYIHEINRVLLLTDWQSKPSIKMLLKSVKFFSMYIEVSPLTIGKIACFLASDKNENPEYADAVA
jgi:hypothetical protein